jgi:formate dehydrogenase subunit beta
MASNGKGATFPAEGSVKQGVLDFIKQALSKGCFDAVLIPAKVPDSDSISYLLISDESLLKDAYPLPPIMPVQGAKAISSLTRRGKVNKKVAVVMRPCETRATAELFKLGQVDLDNIFIISIDCPGVLPLADWLKDEKKAGEAFQEMLKGGDNKVARPLCQICDKFSSTGAEDLHIGVIGAKPGSILLIPNTPKGESILDTLGIPSETDISAWKDKVEKLTEGRKGKRKEAQKELESKAKGLDKLLGALGNCINCHNCMRVCPICYCRQCFFDSEKLQFPFEDYLTRAEMSGGLKFPPETLLFHIGRMLHMSLSCVSCGQCEDNCPTGVPVSQLFSLVGDRNQEAFGYVAGRSLDEPLPLRTYEEEEFLEVEQSYAGTSAKQEAQDA